MLSNLSLLPKKKNKKKTLASWTNITTETKQGHRSSSDLPKIKGEFPFHIRKFTFYFSYIC